VRRTDGEKNTPKASPLPPLAMAILAKLDRSSTRVWSLSVHHSKYKAQLDAACSLEHWTLHDLRRTCRTILTDLGVRYDVGEQVLGHAVGSAVSRIYDKANKRKANPEEERKGVTERIGEALQLLADHISKLTSTPSNVVSLKTAA
jgi:integrase